MAVRWNGFEPFEPGVSQPLHEVAAMEARAVFDRLMAAKPERIETLRRLLSANGLTLSGDDVGLQAVDNWFRTEVQGDASTERLLPEWYGVVNDLALLLGDVMIDRCPGLSWVMVERPKSDVSFQRYVVAGFTQVDNPRYSVDLDLLLATHGVCVVADDEVEDDAFVTWVASAEQMA